MSPLPSERAPHENPFRVDRVTALPFLGEPVDNIARRLAFLQFRAAIVGPEGAGKSTLMRDLANELSATIVIQKISLPGSATRRERAVAVAKVRQVAADVAILVDGFEQLNFLQQRMLLRHKRLTVTVHREIGLPTLMRMRPSLDTLAALLRNLLVEVPSAVLTFAQQRLMDHHGDVRATFFDLYDAWADGRIDARQRDWSVQPGRTLL